MIRLGGKTPKVIRSGWYGLYIPGVEVLEDRCLLSLFGWVKKHILHPVERAVREVVHEVGPLVADVAVTLLTENPALGEAAKDFSTHLLQGQGLIKSLQNTGHDLLHEAESNLLTTAAATGVGLVLPELPSISLPGVAASSLPNLSVLASSLPDLGAAGDNVLSGALGSLDPHTNPQGGTAPAVPVPPNADPSLPADHAGGSSGQSAETTQTAGSTATPTPAATTAKVLAAQTLAEQVKPFTEAASKATELMDDGVKAAEKTIEMLDDGKFFPEGTASRQLVELLGKAEKWLGPISMAPDGVHVLAETWDAWKSQDAAQGLATLSTRGILEVGGPWLAAETGAAATNAALWWLPPVSPPTVLVRVVTPIVVGAGSAVVYEAGVDLSVVKQFSQGTVDAIAQALRSAYDYDTTVIEPLSALPFGITGR